MSRHGTELLAELIGKKHECLIRLRELGNRQLEVVKTGDMELLMKLLAAKQKFLEHLTRLERALDPFREEDPDARQWSSLAERSRCAAVANESDKLLAEVVQQEKQSETELIRRRDEAAGRLSGAHFAGQAHRAYAAGTAPRANLAPLDTPPNTMPEGGLDLTTDA